MNRISLSVALSSLVFLSVSQPTWAGSENVPSSDVQQAAPTEAAGQEATAEATLEVGTSADELKVTTDDVNLARKQVETFPDNPEAHFIYAVALTRTSFVEEALQEVRKARKLAQAQGGSQYFDKLIGTYEKMLTYTPDENRVRYSLSWAYYMKAYLLAQESKRTAQDKETWSMIQQLQAKNLPTAEIQKAAMQVQSGRMSAQEVLANVNAGRSPTDKGQNQIVINSAARALASQAGINAPDKITPIQGALDKADPSAVPQIKKYFESALKQLDEILTRKPDDIWARVYRAHLKAEYTGNLNEAMATWHQCQKSAPDNPASYFFLGEGYLKQGNLKESVKNISKAVALRAIGK